MAIQNTGNPGNPEAPAALSFGCWGCCWWGPPPPINFPTDPTRRARAMELMAENITLHAEHLREQAKKQR